METRRFGSTDLHPGVIGFGAWGIGGAAMAGGTAIGWRDTDDATSLAALRRARECGVSFYDTADFYGLGRSERLIGEAFGSDRSVIVATKVGHRLAPDGTIALDYSRAYIQGACEESLRRLRRDTIDYYQLHSAKVAHLEQGECVEAMETLRAQGKIRWWGISLNTFNPGPEADYMMVHRLGHGFQLALNLLNQRARALAATAAGRGYGVIVRMPLQFGLLAGAFDGSTTFPRGDHRSFRLPADLIRRLDKELAAAWAMPGAQGMSKTALALGFCASLPGVSTVIPGIRTPEQAEANTKGIGTLPGPLVRDLCDLYDTRFAALAPIIESAG